jgi:tetratricopeptide (TPR) repeat protein
MPNVMPIDDVVSRCEQLRGEGAYEESDLLCRRVLVQVPSNAVLLFQNATHAFSASGPKIAMDRFHRVKVTLPGASAVHYNIGICYRRMDDHRAAHHHLQKALVSNPTAAGALDALAHTQTEIKKSATAMKTGLRQVILCPKMSGPYSTLGFAAWKADRLDDAISALKTALLLDPKLCDADINLGSVLAQMGQHADAIRRYRRLLRLAPQNPTLCRNMAVAFVNAGDWREASRIYARYTRLTRGRPENQTGDDPFPNLPVTPLSRTLEPTAWHRLKFEAEQMAYLLDQGAIPADFEAELIAYRSIITNLDETSRAAIAFELPRKDSDRIVRYQNRLVHLASTEWRLSRSTCPVRNPPALDMCVDWAGADADFVESTPSVTVIDDFLDPRALTALRQFCLESTIWFELKGAGYLGAYFREGFNDPLLLAIAEEMATKMPKTFINHPLRMIWAYTYEQSMVGINPHADFAKINVNFWITPNEANLDPGTGGLLIYRRPAPISWGFEKYNAAPSDEIMAFLGTEARNPIRIPHRQNRAVIFDSCLFHETDRLKFRPGLENRRINVTMLFGDQ